MTLELDMTLDYLPLRGKKHLFEVLHGRESCSESHFLKSYVSKEKMLLEKRI